MPRRAAIVSLGWNDLETDRRLRPPQERAPARPAIVPLGWNHLEIDRRGRPAEELAPARRVPRPSFRLRGTIAESTSGGGGSGAVELGAERSEGGVVGERDVEGVAVDRV